MMSSSVVSMRTAVTRARVKRGDFVEAMTSTCCYQTTTTTTTTTSDNARRPDRPLNVGKGYDQMKSSAVIWFY